MTCKDLMTPDPACCVPRDSVVTAAMIMKSQNVGAVPVVSDHESKNIIGMVTDRDLVIRVIAEQREYYSTRVSDVMSKDIVTCRVDDDYNEVLDAMKQHQIRRVPVVDSQKRLVGIVAQADVARQKDEPEEVAHTVRHISEPGPSPHAAEIGGGMSGIRTGLLVAGGLSIGAGLIYLLDPSWIRRARESVSNAAETVNDAVGNVTSDT
jgi:CBS domain-containing protein